MYKQFTRLAVGASLLMAASAHADLFQFGPVDPADGFPQWYQDLNGLALDKCEPTANDAAQVAACMAVLPPIPPFVFPTNFPPEVFYHRVVGNLNIGAGGAKKAVYIAALEASFAPAGVPVAGTQMVFTRIRVTAGVTVAGTYTVTHPYGTEVFPDVVPGVGNRDIFFTEDVGITPLAFTQALTSRVGPFMLPANVTTGVPCPVNAVTAGCPVVQIPAGTGPFYLTDGATLTPITGSPFGTNVFTICGPPGAALDPTTGGDCVSTALFNLEGKVHAAVISSPTAVNKALYFRSAAGTHVDVFATAQAAPGTGTPLLEMFDSQLTAPTPGAAAIPSTLLAGPTALGEHYGQATPFDPTILPAQVAVINTADPPPQIPVIANVMDEVSVVQAVFDPVLGTLTVQATSSDKGVATAVPPIVPPTLSVSAAGIASTLLTPAPTATDPANAQVTIAVPPISATDPRIVPPATVNVASSAGGGVVALISTLSAPGAAVGAPVANPDSATTPLNTPVVVSVLANDTCAGAACTVPTAVVAIVAPPLNGTATVNADGTVTYTPAVNFTGSDSFTYTVTSGGLVSNSAAVSITITPVNVAPVAVNDSAVTPANTATVINVTANDTDANGVAPAPGGLNPASVAIVTPPLATQGTVAVDPATGAVTFTPVAGFAGTATFTYTVSDIGGIPAGSPALTSNVATVSVTVNAVDTITVTRSQCKISGPNAWSVQGNVLVTSTATFTNSATIYADVNAANPFDPAHTVGTGIVGLGALNFTMTARKGEPCSATVNIQTAAGGTALHVPVVVSP